MKKVSVVIPAHNESSNITWFYELLNKQLKLSPDYEFEVIIVDDGSTDDSLTNIRTLHKEYGVRYLSFSRNFGKEAATSAGLAAATGDAVIMIDADGQHPVKLIVTFLNKWHEGFDVVVGVRTGNSGEGFIKRFGSKAFYSLLYLVNRDSYSVRGSTDFRLLDRKVVDQYNLLTERNRVTRNLIDWLGYNRTLIPFVADARHAGDASYSFGKLFKLAINGVISHSTRPLKLIGVLGILISSVSVIAAISLVTEKYILGDPLNLAVSGVAILALFLSFLVGVVLVCQGLLALYIENVHHETQNRPLFVIKEKS